MAEYPPILVYKLRMDCEECGSAIFLNGPVRQVECKACLSRLKIDAGTWRSLLESDAEEYAELVSGKYFTGSLSSGGRKYVYYVSLEHPRCPDCKEELVLDKIDPAVDRIVACTACGCRASTFPAPDWLREKLPRARQLFCAAQEDEDDSAQPPPEALRPVMMSCLHCGGALEITSETTRIAACQYCDTDHYLPDDLWRRLHPLKKRTPWYLFFGDAEWGQTAPTPAAKDHPRQSARPEHNIKCARCGRIVPQRKAFYSEDGEVCGSCFKG
jgi:DNA-directed RNA polymerase subunit RPC12/RpoP